MTVHKHHIVPKHAGGTNDPSNIALLTVEEHAEAHRLLWEQYGRLQDKMAWLGLAGHDAERDAVWLEFQHQPKSEATKQKIRQAAINRALTYIASEETRRKMSEAKLGNTNSRGHVQSQEHKQKNADAQRGNKHAVGNHYTHTESAKQKIQEAALQREARKRSGS